MLAHLSISRICLGLPSANIYETRKYIDCCLKIFGKRWLLGRFWIRQRPKISAQVSALPISGCHVNIKLLKYSLNFINLGNVGPRETTIRYYFPIIQYALAKRLTLWIRAIQNGFEDFLAKRVDKAHHKVPEWCKREWPFVMESPLSPHPPPPPH